MTLPLTKPSARWLLPWVQMPSVASSAPLSVLTRAEVVLSWSKRRASARRRSDAAPASTQPWASAGPVLRQPGGGPAGLGGGGGGGGGPARWWGGLGWGGAGAAGGRLCRLGRWRGGQRPPDMVVGVFGLAQHGRQYFAPGLRDRAVWRRALVLDSLLPQMPSPIHDHLA